MLSRHLDSDNQITYCSTVMSINSIVHLSDAALISVHALAGLADSPDKLVLSRDLAAIIDASEHHVSKVLQRLVKAGLVRSVKGPSGGFRLARKAEDISFKQAIEAVDGELSGDFCPFRTGRCTPGSCIFGAELALHADALVQYLDHRTIADILTDAAGNPEPPYRLLPRSAAV